MSGETIKIKDTIDATSSVSDIVEFAKVHMYSLEDISLARHYLVQKIDACITQEELDQLEGPWAVVNGFYNNLKANIQST